MAAVASPPGSAPLRSHAWARRQFRLEGGTQSGSPLRLRVLALRGAPLRHAAASPKLGASLQKMAAAAPQCGRRFRLPAARSPPVHLRKCAGHTELVPLRCWILAPQERPAAVERRARDGALN
ncbi:hypothetical protein NDU88_005331 [Pleurodeles waltl]|uniref:Uncharacterized protein n=1 Tax=Pleurodeles waltl TaxID=8319 RepID=A0AAV7LNW6_PLEWA|nr:hypothetical protein NDU88_005331 [Pleurodeles waltl]